MGKIWRIGCSGFHYKEWKEFFYPEKLPASKWFEFYAQHFNTLELNVSFYRFPKIAMLKNWHDKAPEDFLFSIKVPRSITHYRHLKGEAPRMLGDFYGLAREGLQNKLGPVLFQLPKQVLYSKEMLDLICTVPDQSFTNVFEFRDKGWWKKKVFERLAEKNIIFCGHSYPGLPDKVVINGTVAYYRFHGVPKLYYSQYKNAFVEEVGLKLSRSRKLKQAFVFFNNTATVAALNNARFLKKIVER